ncbi:MAG: ABC transporter permease subunit [Micromonosporaceae bacterium]
MNLVRSELRKLRTTNMWWIFGVLLLGLTTLSLLAAMAEASFLLDPPQPPEGEVPPGEQPPPGEVPPGEPLPDAAELRVTAAVNLYTAGQFFGLMFALLLGSLLMTNEYAHQTASATFLTTPRRANVVVAKLVTALGIGALFWAVATLVDVIGGVIFLSNADVGPQLGQPKVLAAIGLNLLAYALWAVFGIGLGTLIRSQLATVIVAVAVYVLSGAIGLGVLYGLSQYIEAEWLTDLAVLLPSTASDLMVTGIDWVQMPPRWVGAVVLVGYGVLAGVVGTLITQRRDIG